MGGDNVAAFLNRDAPVALMRNHAKDNVRAMREKERVLRGQRMMVAQARPPEPFKLRQFADIGSRVLQPNGPGLGSNARSASAGPAAAEARRVGCLHQPRSSSAAPAAAEGEDEIGIDDFEDQVANLIRQHGKKQAEEHVVPASLVKDANGCPAYLRKMKEDREDRAKAEQEERSRPYVPAGCRQLPVDEVQETLSALKKKREELAAEERRLPLRIATDSQKRREKQIRERIEETDKAIATFSQPQIFVAA